MTGASFPMGVHKGMDGTCEVRGQFAGAGFLLQPCGNLGITFRSGLVALSIE